MVTREDDDDEELASLRETPFNLEVVVEDVESGCEP